MSSTVLVAPFRYLITRPAFSAMNKESSPRRVAIASGWDNVTTRRSLNAGTPAGAVAVGDDRGEADGVGEGERVGVAEGDGEGDDTDGEGVVGVGVSTARGSDEHATAIMARAAQAATQRSWTILARTMKLSLPTPPLGRRTK